MICWDGSERAPRAGKPTHPRSARRPREPVWHSACLLSAEASLWLLAESPVGRSPPHALSDRAPGPPDAAWLSPGADSAKIVSWALPGSAQNSQNAGKTGVRLAALVTIVARSGSQRDEAAAHGRVAARRPPRTSSPRTSEEQQQQRARRSNSSNSRRSSARTSKQH
ncbi:hypothetical protein C2E23DRAFT_881346 [Lenzites betulinus]|nr:hypothetical protein C2E23DRAFT_881346 [Lenzites betulinus]